MSIELRSYNSIEKNIKYILNKLGNLNDKKVLYIGPGDGVYISDIFLKYSFDLTVIEKNSFFIKDLKKKDITVYNTSILDKIHNLRGSFDVIFSFSLIQYIYPSNLDNFFYINRYYLKSNNSSAVHMSIPDISKRGKNLLNRISNFKKEFRGICFDLVNYIYLYPHYSNDNSFWHDPNKIRKKYKVQISSSDVPYRFDINF